MLIYKSATCEVLMGDCRNIVLKRALEIGAFTEFNCFERDMEWLERLEKFDRTPNIIERFPGKLGALTYAGERITRETIPNDWDKQKNYIIKQLAEYGCKHNDIKPDDILVKASKLYLVDFGWATRFGESLPPEWPKAIGDTFKYPGGYDDEYSFTKAVSYVLKGISYYSTPAINYAE